MRRTFETSYILSGSGYEKADSSGLRGVELKQYQLFIVTLLPLEGLIDAVAASERENGVNVATG